MMEKENDERTNLFRFWNGVESAKTVLLFQCGCSVCAKCKCGKGLYQQHIPSSSTPPKSKSIVLFPFHSVPHPNDALVNWARSNGWMEAMAAAASGEQNV